MGLWGSCATGRVVPKPLTNVLKAVLTSLSGPTSVNSDVNEGVSKTQVPGI